MTWRKSAAAVITPIVQAGRAAGKTNAEIRKDLRPAYPFGPRQHHPYKMWLDEIKVQLGEKHRGGLTRWADTPSRKGPSISRDDKTIPMFGEENAS